MASHFTARPTQDSPDTSFLSVLNSGDTSVTYEINVEFVSCGPPHEPQRRGVRRPTEPSLQPLPTAAPLYHSPGVKIRADLVPAEDTTRSVLQDENVLDILDRLRLCSDETTRNDHIRCILSWTLPSLGKQGKIHEIARFLEVSDFYIQRAAASLLEELLLKLRYSDNEHTSLDLLDVAKTTSSCFLQLSDDDSHAYIVGYLHLLAIAALLSRSVRVRPHLYTQALPALDKEILKQKSPACGMKEIMRRAIHQLLANFEDEVKRQSFQRSWEHTAWEKEECERRQSCYKKSSFCYLFVTAYTLLNECLNIHRTSGDWQQLLSHLIRTLRDLVSSVQTGAKYKLASEAKFVLDLMIVRCCSLLLSTTLVEGVPVSSVGKQTFNCREAIMGFLCDVLKVGDGRLKKETFRLLFNTSPIVRKTIGPLLQESKLPVLLSLGSCIEDCLRKTGFRAYLDYSLPSDDAGCNWNDIRCDLAMRKARLVVLAPSYSCIASINPDLKICAGGHKSVKTRDACTMGECHLRNFDSLVELSVQSKHVLELYAFQYKPFTFYITEVVEGHRLLEYLLDHRHEEKWLEHKTVLCLASKVVECLDFLKNNDMVLRDVSAYNLKVVATGGSGARCDVLPSRSFQMRIADLGLLHSNKTPIYEYDSELIKVHDQGPIPVRWTAPESLIDGSYSEKSMVYSLGCVLFEICTYGCQPYSSFDIPSTSKQSNTEDIARKVIRGKARLHHFQCIHKDMFELITHCTMREPGERPSLATVKDLLTQLEQDDVDSGPLEVRDALDHGRQYPPISAYQAERGSVPERFIPSALQKDITEGKMTKYSTLPRTRLAVTSGELEPDDRLKITASGNETVVQEDVKEEFVKNVLERLKSNRLDGITTHQDSTIEMKLTTEKTRLKLERHLPVRTTSLFDLARTGKLWPNPDDESFCVSVFVKISDTLKMIHDKGFCHRDIKAKNILISIHGDSQEVGVFFARLGRMCVLRDEGDIVKEVKPFRDSIRWSPPEVLVDGIYYGQACYSPRSDVFMLATVFWETYRIRELTPHGTRKLDERLCVPFHLVPVEKVNDYVKRDPSQVLLRPKNCPRWLFDVILKCRDPHRDKRPFIFEIRHDLVVGRGNGSESWHFTSSPYGYLSPVRRKEFRPLSRVLSSFDEETDIYHDFPDFPENAPPLPDSLSLSNLSMFTPAERSTPIYETPYGLISAERSRSASSSSAPPPLPRRPADLGGNVYETFVSPDGRARQASTPVPLPRSRFTGSRLSTGRGEPMPMSRFRHDASGGHLRTHPEDASGNPDYQEISPLHHDGTVHEYDEPDVSSGSAGKGFRL